MEDNFIQTDPNDQYTTVEGGKKLLYKIFYNTLLCVNW